MNIKTLVVSMLLLVSSTLTYAQKTPSFFKGWSLGVNLGTTQFDGDIRQYHHIPAYQQENANLESGFSELRSAVSFSLNKKINSLYSLSAELTTGSFAGLRRPNEYWEYSIYDPGNLYKGGGDRFVTSFTEVDFLVDINLSRGLIGDMLKLNSCKKWTLHAKAGFGINFSDILRTNLMDGSYIYSVGHKQDHPQLKETVYVYGIKAIYDLNPKLDLSIDYTIRNGQTDMWDGSMMASDRGSDRFNFLSLGIAYKFGKHDYNKKDASSLERLRRDARKALVKIDRLMDDSDNDGVADVFDKSLNTPLDVAVDGSGRAMDIDMDNIPDYRDVDPFSNKGVQVDENGVELVGDMSNSKDSESSTAAGIMAAQFPSIYFNLASAIVESSNESKMATIALLLKSNTSLKLKVIGHTDNVGNTEFNRALGLKRANAVIKYLVLSYNIEANRLIAVTKGEDDPLSAVTQIANAVEIDESTNRLAEINRRVDFEIAN